VLSQAHYGERVKTIAIPRNRVWFPDDNLSLEHQINLNDCGWRERKKNL